MTNQEPIVFSHTGSLGSLVQVANMFGMNGMKVIVAEADEITVNVALVVVDPTHSTPSTATSKPSQKPKLDAFHAPPAKVVFTPHPSNNGMDDAGFDSLDGGGML